MSNQVSSKTIYFSLRNNKRAQIGSTISWFFAVITIFLILIVFLVFVAFSGIVKIGNIKEVKDSSNIPTMNYVSFRGASFLLEKNNFNEKIIYSGTFFPDIYLESLTQKDCYDYNLSLGGENSFIEGKSLLSKEVVSQVVLTFSPVKMETIDGKKMVDNQIKLGVRYICDE
jgi:hypothetical protein